MAKTIEAYVRMNQVAAQLQDKAFFVGDERSVLFGANFVPDSSFQDITRVEEALEPTLGPAANQVFAVQRMDVEDMIDYVENIVVATGICPYPMDYNTSLAPSSGPGSAAWYAQGDESLESFLLATDLLEAVEQINANPPPMSVANLMKSGGTARSKTILIEEVGFYTDWMLDKLIANCPTAPSEEDVELAKKQLAAGICAQYDRYAKSYEIMRRLVQGTTELGTLERVQDTRPEYQAAMNEQVERYINDLSGGYALDESGLRVAAYYSGALNQAYVDCEVLKSDEKLVIGEGAANLVIPDDANKFNIARRRVGQVLATDVSAPPLFAYPSSSTSPVIRKDRLEAESVDLSPSSMKPNVQAYLRGNYLDPSVPVVESPPLRWSLALPGTPELDALQAAALRDTTRGSREVKINIVNAMQQALDEIFEVKSR